MTEQATASTEFKSSSQPAVTSQKLGHLLDALNRLKSDISCVEARHPAFGNELSSLCDTAIADLNSLYSLDSAAKQNYKGCQDAGPDGPPDTPAPTPGIKRGANPIASAIDRAGSGLITGLDRTGDGIIFILSKLFAERAPRAGTGAPAEADL